MTSEFLGLHVLELGPWQLGGLLVAIALLHEDVAIVLGGFFVIEGGLPLSVAYASLFLGIVLGDLIIYGIGYFAHSIERLRRIFIHDNVGRVRYWLDRSLVRLVMASKVTPGMLFPVYLACGWFRVSFSRFLVATVLTSALQSSLELTLIIVFGEAVLRHAGPWSWVGVAAVIVILSYTGMRHPKWKRLDAATRRDWRRTDMVSNADRSGTARRHRGMPSLNGMKRHIALAEHIPAQLFYLPLAAHWVYLAVRHRSLTLPTAANPMIEGGGFSGESKSSCLRQIGAQYQPWVAPFITCHRAPGGLASQVANAQARLAAVGIAFPLVAKPDIGWQGYGVQLLHNAAELEDYLHDFPEGADIILQHNVTVDGEAGVFYMRRPDEARGVVTSLTLRYFPFVCGDGRLPLRDLILRNSRAGWRADYYLGDRKEHAGFSDAELERVPAEGELVRLAFIKSIRVGGLYRDGGSYISEALTARIDAIARSMPEFYFGRFDIKFASLEELQRGENFQIIEVNGIGSEDIHVWDPEKTLGQVYRGLFTTQTNLFTIAALNRVRGHQPLALSKLIRLIRRQNRLIRRYPRAA